MLYLVGMIHRDGRIESDKEIEQIMDVFGYPSSSSQTRQDCGGDGGSYLLLLLTSNCHVVSS